MDVRVLRGEPSAEEVAALLVALQAAAGRDASHEPDLRHPSAWAQAGRLEALGLAVVRSLADLRAAAGS